MVLLFNFTPWSTKKKGHLPDSVTTAHTITETKNCFLATTRDPSSPFLDQTRSFWVLKWWNWTSRTIEMTSLLVHSFPEHESTSKTGPGLFSRALPYYMGPKKLRSAFSRMFRTSLPKRNEPHLPPIWILWILGSGHTFRVRARTVHHQSLEALKIKLLFSFHSYNHFKL